MESVEAIAQLLAGERVTARGAQIDMRDAEVIGPDHAGPVRWSPAVLTHQLTTVRRAAEQVGRAPQLEVLVQVVEVTDNRDQALTRLVERIPGLSVVDAAATPHVLIGSADEIVDQLQRQAEELEITRYVVREPAARDIAPLLSRLQS